jgi:hypothetical protein
MQVPCICIEMITVNGADLAQESRWQGTDMNEGFECMARNNLAPSATLGITLILYTSLEENQREGEIFHRRRMRELGNVRCYGILMHADNICVSWKEKPSSRLVISHLVKSLEASEQ